jgi:hypothetical protein
MLFTDVSLSLSSTHKITLMDLVLYYTTINQILHLFVFNPYKVYYDEASVRRGMIK